ncbi:MAG: MFS transporter [Dehalococcoidia bacterium]|nr:MAG: MFS transporter [Dehalococcoidia bacterium]
MKVNPIGNFRLHPLLKGLLPLFVLAHFLHHLYTALLVPLLPLIRNEFALDYTKSGLLLSVFSLTYGISHLPAGWLADRIGARILITIAICGVALAGLLVGFSQTYIMMLGSLALMGLLGGGYHTTSPPLISASASKNTKGRALGVHLIGGSFSFFLAPLIAAAIAVALGWRAPFLILAIPSIAFGAIFYIILGRLSGKISYNPKPKSMVDDKSQKSSHHLVPFIILATFTAAVLFSTISFIPLFLVDNFGLTEEAAAAFIAVIYLAGLVASPLGGYLSDRFGRVAVLLTASFVAGPIIYMLDIASFSVGIIFILIFIGIILYMPQPASEAYIVDQVSSQRRSSILGIYFSGGILGSSAIIPLLGYSIDNYGFTTSFTITGVALVAVTLICSIWLLKIAIRRI